MSPKLIPSDQGGTASAIMALTYGPAEVAAALGYRTLTAFRRARPQLEAAGFPRRIPNMGARWSRAAVDAWVAQAGTEG